MCQNILRIVVLLDVQLTLRFVAFAGVTVPFNWDDFPTVTSRLVGERLIPVGGTELVDTVLISTPERFAAPPLVEMLIVPSLMVVLNGPSLAHDPLRR